MDIKDFAYSTLSKNSMIKGVVIDKPFHKHRVYRNGKQISWKRSMYYVRKSPTGFNWGYSGAGPQQLAFALIFELTNAKIAYALYYTFAHEFLTKFPHGKDFIVSEKQVYAAIKHAAKTPHIFPLPFRIQANEAKLS